MKISTLNRPVTHERNIMHDSQRFDALAREMEAFCADIEQEIRENYVCSHLSMLQQIAPDLNGLILCGMLVILTFTENIRYVNIDGLDSVGVTQALILCAKGDE